MATGEEVARSVAGSLLNGDFDAVVGRLGGAIKQMLTRDQLEMGWLQVVKQFGAPTTVGEPERAELGGKDVHVVTADAPKAPFEIVVAVENGSVTGLLLRPKTPSVVHPPPPYAPGGSFEDRRAEVGDLPATLTVPKKGGFLKKKAARVPGVVFVHGSGPNDRNETVGGSAVFLDLAWGLANSGIASLRYEKRTRAMPGSLTEPITVENEVIDDALGAVRVLRETAGIGPVFVLGHSLGGTLVPAIGARDPAIAGLIVVAGATRPFGAMVLDQMRYLSSLGGAPLPEGLEETCARADDPNLTAKTPASKLPLGVGAPYLLSLRAHSPQEWMSKATQPMLVVHAGRDYQVVDEDLAGWRRAAESRPGVEFRVYPRLNHLLTSGEGPSTPQEYERPANVDRQLVKDVAAWVARVARAIPGA